MERRQVHCGPGEGRPNVKRVLFVGNSHLLSLIEAARLTCDVVEESLDHRSIWASRAFHRLDTTFPASGARARFLLSGGFAPPVLTIRADGTFGVGAEHLTELDAAEASLGGPPDLVVSCVNGNEHWIFAFVEHPQPFDVVISAGDTIAPGRNGARQVVPLEVLRRELDGRVNATVLTCDVLQARFPSAEVVHVLSPPPIPDEAHIEADPEVFVELLTRYGLAPAPLRRKVYRVYGDVLEARLAEIGVRLLGPPDGTIDDGYLREDLWVGATHAGPEYGRQRAGSRGGGLMHPYRDQPDRAFWRRAVVGRPWTDVPFDRSDAPVLGTSTRIATAGSCFAANLLRWLPRLGLRPFVTEHSAAVVHRGRGRGPMAIESSAPDTATCTPPDSSDSSSRKRSASVRCWRSSRPMPRGTFDLLRPPRSSWRLPIGRGGQARSHLPPRLRTDAPGRL